VIEAARAEGAGRILYTSHVGANPAFAFPATAAHAETERDLEKSGVPFTALRNGFYAASAFLLMGQALRTGTIAVPEDGPPASTGSPRR
jgi:NAD(P)H dehydrogenase (quinone)